MQRTIIPSFRSTRHCLALALAVTGLSNSVVQAVPYASGVKKTGDTVTFILNQRAQGLAVLTNGVPMAHSIDYSTAGSKSFDMPGATTFSIMVTGNTAKAWTQISSDSLTQSKYFNPRGVTVDTNPKRSTFGRIIVSEGQGGAVTAGGRTTTDGIYMMSADQGDITSQANTAYAGGIDWTSGGLNSPWKISMNRADPLGQDYNIYISDWSDPHSGVWTADALNPGAAFNELLSNAGRASSGLVANLHGSISSGAWVESTGADRKMYTLDEDYQLGNIWQYDIGTTTSGYATSPTARVGAYGLGLIGNARADIVRDEDGSWWLTQYRSTDATTTPALSHWTDNSHTWTWRSGASPVQLNNAYGSIDIHNELDLLVLGSVGSQIYVLSISNAASPVIVTNIPHTGTTILDVAFDAAGNIYAVSSSSQTLRIYSPGGQTVAATGFDGTDSWFQLLPVPVTVTVTEANAIEGGAPGVFTITRKAFDLSSPLTVNYTMTGTATSGVDYTNLTGSVVIPAGATSAEVYVQALDDSDSEATETAILTLSPSANYKAKSGPATVNIVDTDTQVISVVVSPSMYERVGSDYANVIIQRNLGSTNGYLYFSDVGMLSFGGTAVMNVDYVVNTNLFSPFYLNAGERTATIAKIISPIDNALLDGTRTVMVTVPSGTDLNGQPYIGATNLATCKIIDDEDPAETVLWSDNFNTDSLPNYALKFAALSPVEDYAANWVDYSGDPYYAPAAPHSGGDTHGLHLNVNKDALTNAAGVNLYPNGQSFSGDYALRFDMYLFQGLSATTEYTIFGINHSGTRTNWFRLSQNGFTNSSYDGIWAVVESDASGTDDYLLFSSPATTGTVRTPTYRARAGAGTFKEVFKSPPFTPGSVGGGSPANLAGSATPVWADVELAQVGNVVTLRINHTKIFDYTNATAEIAGNIMLGYDDAYDSTGNSLGVLYDNVRVVRMYPPTIVTQPVDSVTPPGGTANFSVVVSGSTTGFTNYQWRFNGVAIAGATNASLTLDNVQLANYGAYTVVISDGNYSVTSVVANLVVLPSSIALGSGTGLAAGYWTLHTNNAPFTGSPTLTRLDSLVNFEWVTGSPNASISTDYFTARWVGQIQALGSGSDTYTFTTMTDDGTRLWINGQLVMDSWIPQSGAPHYGTITLSGTNKYDVVMEYFEAAGNASAKLYWSNATTVGYSAVPQSQLYPAASVMPAVTLTGPANGSSYQAPATITLAASITDNKNIPQYVSFYNGGTLIGSATTAPYEYTWNNVPAGNYNLTATLVYNTNWTVFSAVTNSVTVIQPLAPVSSFGIATGPGSQMTLSYSGGAGAKFILLQNNNAAAPLAGWTRVQTNNSTPGSFIITPGSDPALFYRIISE